MVDDTADETVRLQHRERLHGSTSTHEVRALHVLLTGQDVVHLATGIVVGQLPPLVHGQKDTVGQLD